jgi:DNA-binding response OmpR family regulator
VDIRVTDTGIGIPAEALPKIFDRFYQVENGQARAGGGTGIGLALSKELAERMGGSLRAESMPGQGAAFFFQLPVRNTAGTPLLEYPDGEPGTAVFSGSIGADMPTDSERPLALLIEDNAELRGFMLKCIAGQWQVAEASDGEEGLAKAKTLLPDIVISDLMMPRKDGYAVCRELRDDELTAHIPVILLTARSTPEAKIKGLQTGADDYLTKPFNADELLARMHNLVEQRRRLRLRYSGTTATNGAAESDGDGLTSPDRDFLRRFTAIVEQNLADETIGVEELARKMCISRVQLHRKLKAVTGRNVTDFVRDYRLERAMAMLRNREGLVYEIAAQVGFGSEKYFSRAFKEKFGVSPSQVA